MTVAERTLDKVTGSFTGSSTPAPDRRGFLARTAVVGSALTVGPWGFLTRPQSAYAAVCGIDATCSSGYTVFCATIGNGVNRCPPGSLVGGWWKSDGSGFCCGGARYYIDCHSYCSCGCGGRASSAARAAGTARAAAARPASATSARCAATSSATGSATRTRAACPVPCGAAS